MRIISINHAHSRRRTLHRNPGQCACCHAGVLYSQCATALPTPLTPLLKVAPKAYSFGLYIRSNSAVFPRYNLSVNRL